MIRSFACALALCALPMPASAHDPEPPSQLRFHKFSVPGHEIITVAVFMRQNRTGDQIYYQFRRSYGENDNSKGRSAGWADTGCAGSREALEHLARLQMPQPLVPGLLSNDSAEATMDGWSYSLEGSAAAPYRQNYMKLTSDAGSPLARWVDETLAILEPCWVE